MYLSRVQLDTDLRATKLALANPQMMHALVAGCFDNAPVKQRPLWRIDRLAGSNYLLLVSEDRPDFSSLLAQLSSGEGHEVITKEYTQFLDSIAEGDTYRFRLSANPVHSTMPDSGLGSRGKVYGHITVDQQKEWLKKRDTKLGFEISAFELTGRAVRKFKRQGKTVTLSMASFEGVLQVADVGLLQKALTQGIGRAKAYGCGLLTVARL